MAPKLERQELADGSFIDAAIDAISSDQWRPHGVRYRLAWVQNGKCRVLFDNHTGKMDHYHVDGEEYHYRFVGVEKLVDDFRAAIRSLGGTV